VAPAVELNYHGGTVATQGKIMSQDSKPDTADTLRALVALRGLGRAFALSPEIMAAAFERGGRPIGSFPESFSPTTEPASRFSADPEASK